MDTMKVLLCIFVYLCNFEDFTTGISYRLLFPFGEEKGDTVLQAGDDVSSNEIQLKTPIVFFDQRYSSIYVNNNGHLSFESELPQYNPRLVLPTGFKLIAAFLADIDTTATGQVFYRESQEQELLERAALEVQQHFSNFDDYMPTSLFLATWDNVGYYNGNDTQGNSFQILIASDGQDSFVCFHYLDDGINWLASKGKFRDQNVNDPPAQAGFDSGEGRLHLKLPFSGKPRVKSLASESNVNVPGVWIYQIGRTNGGNIIGPDLNTGEVTIFEPEETIKSCAEGVKFCHINAECKNYTNGFCCHCIRPHYGNGLQCLAPETPQRLNGKVFGTLNGVSLDNLDMHSYVVTSDGRAYTAISRIPTELGQRMLTLNTVGGIIGWMFAEMKGPLALNGYVYTGLIKSYSSRVYRMNDVAYRYSWDQTINFKECEYDNRQQSSDTMRLSVTKNFVVYDDLDMVIRFAMTNKIAVFTGTDPCEDGAQYCDQNADCVTRGDQYQCQCRPGYVGDGKTCGDINECSAELNVCHSAAKCYNVPGSFQCQCLPGYRGDGRICERDDATICGVDVCHVHAQCVYNSDLQRPACECRSGYRGNGTYCTSAAFTCLEVDICHDDAQCVYDSDNDEYRCECNEGYSGDGENCEQTVQCSEECDVNAECTFDVDQLIYQCRCKVGYSGDGRTCAPIDIAEECYKCDPNARCVENPNTGTYECRCVTGYTGNGYECQVLDCRVHQICDQNADCVDDPFFGGYRCLCRNGFVVVSCNQVNNCSPNAECVYDPNASSYRCRCRPGYAGDGYTCQSRGIDCRRDPGLCDPNASCMLNVDTFMCVCNPNYRGDGQRCYVVSDEDSYLLVARGSSIQKVTFGPDDNNLDNRVMYASDQLVIALDTDCQEGDLYWTDVYHGQIRKSKHDGTGQSQVIGDSKFVLYPPDLSSPEGIAVDFVSRNIYWTDSGLDIIGVSLLNGTYKKRLIDSDLVNPRAIVLDLTRSMMYWTDWNRNRPKIEKAYMDGTNRKTFVEIDSAGLPNGLTLDYQTQQICWGDAGVRRIECVRSDGVGRRIITDEAPYPFDVAVFENSIYWTDWTIKGISSVNRNGVLSDEPLKMSPGGNGKLYGMTVVQASCPRVTNACMRNNGGCQFLCLPTPGGGRSCACPDNVDQDRCNEIILSKKKK
ncbi:hypothetical protein KUTeg_014294 [Tegillarca granosa]|uniref:Nidogen n=1 Tax=Tegillarca granosa TaxID=220873 RepID=A0ABQ9F1D9_TEGGR|nr:hypothetical protein KUTeg_014294 [Tegillarca granosa]